MIFYFSGTGNSKWVAEEIARRTGDEAQSIAGLVKDGPTVVYAGADACIGVVFPIYAWGVPLIVERFCKSITLAGAYAFAVCTCGDEAGKAMLRLKKSFAYQGAWSVKMPNNYIAGFDVDSPELERSKIAEAKKRLDTISNAVLAKSTVYDVCEGSGASIKTALVRPMFNTFARSTKRFSVESSCNGCGLCARGCPIGAIQMQNEKPVWIRKHCTQCMACINRCPQRAIQMGEDTKNRGRYYFKTDSLT
ncbi:MAG: EFR1 family ferrodoxin [Eubacteriales bacterium]|nr:EFR1 family ferrodoxin [Eubacteriales bacterium]